MPQVSVIVPAYRPGGFAELKASIAANAGVDAEWIVIDDGSGPRYDASFASLEGTAARVIRHTENRRQGAARNAGLARAQGRWVKFLDADDRLDTGHLAILLDAAERIAEDAIPFAPTRHMFANGATSLNDSWRALPADPQAQYRRQLVRPFLHHCGALFPRELLERLGGYDEGLITDEDGDLLLRVLKVGYHFVAVESVYYLYAHHDVGRRVSADDDITKMQARIRVCKKVEAAWGQGMPDDIRHALAQRMDKIAMAYWPAFTDEARSLLSSAETLAPGYRPDLRAPLRLLRAVGGPGMVFAATGLYRRLRGRPSGGTQA